MKQREIKFRAWHKVDKEMKPVNSLKSICTDSVRLSESEYHDLIIMQFTGLKDKNGKDIYEGDIVKYFLMIFRIEWNVKFARFGLFDEYGQTDFYLNSNNYFGKEGIEWKDEDVEVIGNIYENPELLANAKDGL